jgi:hypothetical protein
MTQRAGGVAQVVECLPCKHIALSSKPNTATEIKGKKMTQKLVLYLRDPK